MTIATPWPAKTPSITGLGAYNSKTDGEILLHDKILVSTIRHNFFQGSKNYIHWVQQIGPEMQVNEKSPEKS